MVSINTEKKVAGATFPGYMIDDFKYVSSISNIHPNALTCNGIEISTVQTGMDCLIPAVPAINEVEEWVKEDLRHSGIDWNEFHSFGGRVIDSAADFLELLGYVPSCLDGKAAGWMLPFYNPKNGEELIGADGMPYFRIRMRYPAQTADKKPAKYLSRKNAGQHAFILATVHEQLTHDPQTPLILTEGEKKAWCATNHGRPLDLRATSAGHFPAQKNFCLNGWNILIKSVPFSSFGTAMRVTTACFNRQPVSLQPHSNRTDAR